MPSRKACPLRWGPLSIFSAEGQALNACDVLPSLLNIPEYVRPGMRARHSRTTLAWACFEAMDLAQQQAACRRLLRKLGLLYLDSQSVAPGSKPFAKQYMHITRERVVQDAAAAPALPYHPLMFDLQQRRQAVLLVVIESPTCMLHTATKHWQVPYLKVHLVGRRAGKRSPVNEYAHRVVCWIAHGPPSSDASLMSKPELGRWHRANWVVGHLCGNARCLCPQHLAWLRPADNQECQRWHAQHGKGPQRLWPGPGSL